MFNDVLAGRLNAIRVITDAAGLRGRFKYFFDGDKSMEEIAAAALCGEEEADDITSDAEIDEHDDREL